MEIVSDHKSEEIIFQGFAKVCVEVHHRHGEIRENGSLE